MHLEKPPSTSPPAVLLVVLDDSDTFEKKEVP